MILRNCFELVFNKEERNEIKKIIKDLIIELVELDKILSETGHGVLLFRTGDETIMTRREKDIRILLSAYMKKIAIVEGVEVVFYSLEQRTKDIFKKIYVDNNTWECVCIEMQVSKSTISRKKKKLETLVVDYLKKNKIIENEKDFDSCIGGECKNKNNTIPIPTRDELYQQMNFLDLIYITKSREYKIAEDSQFNKNIY